MLLCKLSKKLMDNKKNIVVYALTILLSITYIVGFNKIYNKDLNLFQNGNDSVKAKVVEIIKTDVNEFHLGMNDVHEETNIYFKAKILSGEKKGKIITGVQQINDLYAGQQKEIKKGNKILLMEVDYFEDANYLMVEYLRSDSLILLGILFFIFLLLFGKTKGISTIISLIFTCLSIFLVFIPAILSGQSIYLWSIITCSFIIIMTLLLINGISKKTLCSIIGCFSGIIITSILTIIMSKFLSLTGIVDEQSYYLQLMDSSNPFDLKAIIFAGIILGAIGAIMDVAVSISAALLEVYEKAKNEDKNIKSLMKSGLTIGRDMMGTMSNTLVMAYIGGSLSTTILLLVYSGSLIELLNKEMIIVELLQIIVGSFGLLLTIPLTSFICSLIYCRKKQVQI